FSGVLLNLHQRGWTSGPSASRTWSGVVSAVLLSGHQLTPGPEAHQAVAPRTGEGLAVGGERQGVDTPDVSAAASQLLPRRHVEDADRAVRAAGKQQRPVR